MRICYAARPIGDTELSYRICAATFPGTWPAQGPGECWIADNRRRRKALTPVDWGASARGSLTNARILHLQQDPCQGRSAPSSARPLTWRSSPPQSPSRIPSLGAERITEAPHLAPQSKAPRTTAIRSSAGRPEAPGVEPERSVAVPGEVLARDLDPDQAVLRECLHNPCPVVVPVLQPPLPLARSGTQEYRGWPQPVVPYRPSGR